MNTPNIETCPKNPRSGLDTQYGGGNRKKFDLFEAGKEIGYGLRLPVRRT